MDTKKKFLISKKVDFEITENILNTKLFVNVSHKILV